MKILLVDDERESRSFLANYLTLQGHIVKECDSGEEALEAYKENRFQMVLSDIKMTGMSGIELIEKIKSLDIVPKADLVLYTGFVDISLAISALRAGAYDYLTKPINFEELRSILKRVEEHQALLYENKMLTEHFDEKVKEATKDAEYEVTILKQLVAKQAEIGNIGVFSGVMKNLVKHAQQYHTDRTVPVLIQGETGVGKEVIAKIIHYGNMENPRPFVDINCAAISPTLFESELFGYEGGSFTGGVAKGQKGKFDIAAGGTLFLDEIIELPLELQAKLLRVLEEKSFYRVGGLKKIKTDVRIIGTANLDFEKQIEEGMFRKDLFYRLEVGRIFIPPLREREEDILPLALMFLKSFSKRRGKHFSSISEQAARFLLTYQWPGNVRELRNTMEWVSFMFDDDELRLEHLSNLTPKGIGEKKDTKSLPANPIVLDQHIDELVEEALRIYNGNKTKAANHLGISVRALYYRLERMRKNVEK